ncbi:MAG: cation diffusion facilitator family transporter, partial [Pseudomonadota bacterium]
PMRLICSPILSRLRLRGSPFGSINTFGFMFADVVGGLLSGSLTLLADAAHMLTDSIALAFAWFAFRIARRAADAHRTFGFHRLQVIVAMVNGLALFVITIEAVERFRDPAEVAGGTVLVIGLLGFAVNLISFRFLSGAGQDNLNVRRAALHILGGILGSVAAFVSAIVILLTAWYPIDPILSIVVSVIILRSARRLVLKAGHALMEGTPDGIDIATIQKRSHGVHRRDL